VRSIRRHLTRHLLVAVLLLLGGGLGTLYYAARDAAIDQFDDALQVKALAVSTMTQHTREGVELEFSDRFFRGFDDDKARDFFVLWDRRGRVLARSDSMRDDDRELPRRVGSLDRPARWNLTLPNGRPGRAVGFAFKPRGGRERNRDDDEVQLVVASNRRDLDETLWRLLGISAGCGVLLLSATLGIIPLVLRRGLRPLETLGESVRRINADTLSTRVATENLPAELQPIAERLNDLLERLEASFERERRFSADLAHELRTPLAELRSAAECALKWPDTRDSATDRETLSIAKHMERIVSHILALARGEQGQLAVTLEPIALDVLAQEVWPNFAPRAAANGLEVTRAIEPVTATADPVLLRSIVVNLFENAVDYTPAGGVLLIAVASGPVSPQIRVTNTAPADFDFEASNLFERFWRNEAARSGGHHVGLGLALSRTFAHAMGWSLTARLDEHRNLVFTLRREDKSQGNSLPVTFA
jgi:two-component system sensor histidine kinase QseC